MPEEISNVPTSAAPRVASRAGELLREHQQQIWRHTDQLFVKLLIVQTLAGIFLALWRSPVTWNGAQTQVHPHVWQSIFLGAAILAAPICFVRLRPGQAITRHVVAVSQMLSSALLIHLGDGRPEMHFHVFGSLAFLAFYRDWRVLISASMVVALDHFVRGVFLPESVFGLQAASNWRWLEHTGWVLFEDLFLIASCVRGSREMEQIAARQAQVELSRQNIEDKVRERTRQLEELQKDLLKVARSAGMAEIATSVLHNVGNVLNSVNVSVRVATERIEQSAVENLAKVVRLLDEHEQNVGAFISSDQKGKQIPAYLHAVSEALVSEQAELLSEMNSLGKNVDHIKEIVHLQQSHVKGAGVIETLSLRDAIEDGLRVVLPAANQMGIVVERQYAGSPEVTTEKHLLLQILINLLGNAKHAVLDTPSADKRVVVRIVQTNGESQSVRMEVQDNGIGIKAENLTRIFNYGFTTKKEGHGFGLHSSANTARMLGGTLAVRSEGPGQGAIFTLELPVSREVANV